MSRPRVKICGLTRVEDAELAVRLGADAVGFVLWPRSPRHISLWDAAAIARALPPFVTRVGVVVDMPPDEAALAVRTVGLDVLQLHGTETVEDYRSVPARLVKAMALETDDDVVRALALPADVGVLVDAVDREARGGTGRRADWSRAAQVSRARPVILAGGITAESVADAVAQVRPWAVDVSSGVEDSPGVKSAIRMTEFFAALARIPEFEVRSSKFEVDDDHD